MLTLFSPLEQFQIVPIFFFTLGKYDFSLTNSTVIMVLGAAAFCFILKTLLVNDFYFLIPNRWQNLIESLYELTSGLLFDIVGQKGQKYFPFLFSLLAFLLMSNLIGLIPYSFTVTSHLIVTFSLALMSF